MPEIRFIGSIIDLDLSAGSTNTRVYIVGTNMIIFKNYYYPGQKTLFGKKIVKSLETKFLTKIQMEIRQFEMENHCPCYQIKH